METENDAAAQTDELEALSAIYGEDLVTEEAGAAYIRSVSMTVREDSRPEVELKLIVKIPTDYPSTSPPAFEISSPYLDGAAKQKLARNLQEIYMENIGQPVLFHWFEAARVFLNNADSRSKIGDQVQGLDDTKIDTQFLEVTQPDEDTDLDLVDVKSGEPLTDRKSTFQAHLATPILKKEQVHKVLKQLKMNSKIARATHNMFAYRIYDGRICVQDCDDDGENQAGSRLLHLLEMMDARNVLVVVSRWYGGVHLGPDRFKHISNVARDLLEAHGFGAKQQAQMSELKKSDKKK